jgi:hypothetical protein
MVPAFVVGIAATATAQTAVGLPDQSQSTTLTANVSEQARVTVPASITFNVANVSAATAAAAASMTVQNIVLSSASKQFQVSVRANAAGFTPPTVGAITWAASDVTWGNNAWTNATAAAGTLSDGAFNTVATCDAGATGCSTNALTFTLGSKATVTRSGSHTLVVTWRFESIGS